MKRRAGDRARARLPKRKSFIKIRPLVSRLARAAALTLLRLAENARRSTGMKFFPLKPARTCPLAIGGGEYL